MSHSTLESGGVIAWGIVPSDPKVFGRETVESLTNRYLEIRKTVTEHVDGEIFDRASLITPSCGSSSGPRERRSPSWKRRRPSLSVSMR